MTERFVVNVLVVAGTLAMTWGPLVYLMRAVAMGQGVTA